LQAKNAEGRLMTKPRLSMILALAVCLGTTALAQKHEIAVTSGALRVGDRDIDLPRPGLLRTGTGFSYQINYARRFFNARVASLYFEFPLVVTPRTEIEASNALLPRSYSSIFFTPGIKLKLVPGSKYSPYGLGGIGYARFNSSDTLLDEGPNTGDRNANRAVFNYGIGLDVKVFPYVSLRGEVRDLYSGNPEFNSEVIGDRQHNTLISAGIVIRF
jgi:opacity protein-like surface antigen